MIKLGDLVRVIADQSSFYGKMGIVVIQGTWSRDVHLFDHDHEYRFPVEHLEKITK